MKTKTNKNQYKIPGGTTGQALIKQSNADFDFDWGTPGGSGATDPAFFMIPNTGDWVGSNLSLGTNPLSINTQDPTRSNFVWCKGGNTFQFSLILATKGISGNFTYKTIISFSTLASHLYTCAIDNNYIYVIERTGTTIVYVYDYTGTLITTNTGLNNIPTTPFGAVSIGNKLFVAYGTFGIEHIREYAISGSTVTDTTDYTISGIGSNGGNLYKETDSNTNILIITQGSSINMKDYSSNTTIPIPTFASAYQTTKPGNAGEYVYYRPNKGDYVSLSGWDTNAGGTGAEMYGQPLVGQAFDSLQLVL